MELVTLRKSFGVAALAALALDRFLLSLEGTEPPDETQWRELREKATDLDIANLHALGQLEKHLGVAVIETV